MQRNALMHCTHQHIHLVFLATHAPTRNETWFRDPIPIPIPSPYGFILVLHPIIIIIIIIII